MQRELQEMIRSCPEAPPFSEPWLKARHHMVQQSSDSGSQKVVDVDTARNGQGPLLTQQGISVDLPEPAVTLRLLIQHK